MMEERMRRRSSTPGTKPSPPSNVKEVKKEPPKKEPPKKEKTEKEKEKEKERLEKEKAEEKERLEKEKKEKAKEPPKKEKGKEVKEPKEKEREVRETRQRDKERKEEKKEDKEISSVIVEIPVENPSEDSPKPMEISSETPASSTSVNPSASSSSATAANPSAENQNSVANPSSSSSSSGNQNQANRPMSKLVMGPNGYYARPIQRYRKKRNFTNDLRHLMYGYGDDPNPAADSVDLLEDIVMEYIVDTTRKAAKIAHGRGRNKVGTEDVIFCVRKDPKKIARVEELLFMNEEVKRAKKAFDADEMVADKETS